MLHNSTGRTPKAYDLPAYKAEKFRFSPMHLVVAVLSTARNMTYLFMQLSSTVLVVPIVKIVSAAMHCVEDEDCRHDLRVTCLGPGSALGSIGGQRWGSSIDDRPEAWGDTSPQSEGGWPETWPGLGARFCARRAACAHGPLIA